MIRFDQNKITANKSMYERMIVRADLREPMVGLYPLHCGVDVIPRRLGMREQPAYDCDDRRSDLQICKF